MEPGGGGSSFKNSQGTVVPAARHAISSAGRHSHFKTLSTKWLRYLAKYLATYNITYTVITHLNFMGRSWLFIPNLHSFQAAPKQQGCLQLQYASHVTHCPSYWPDLCMKVIFYRTKTLRTSPIHVQSCLSKPLKPEEQNIAELCRTQLSSTIIYSLRAQRVPGNAGFHVLSLRRERRDSRTIPECVLRGRNALGAFERHLTWQDITRPSCASDPMISMIGQ